MSTTDAKLADEIIERINSAPEDLGRQLHIYDELGEHGSRVLTVFMLRNPGRKPLIARNDLAWFIGLNDQGKN